MNLPSNVVVMNQEIAWGLSRIVSPESLTSSDRGRTSLFLQTQTSRNVKRNPRFRRPDFSFKTFARHSHTSNL